MKTINENGLNILRGYDEIENGEKFIYRNHYEWFSIKVNEDYAVFLNGANKFIVAKKYKNCLSIGSTCILEFQSYEDALKYIDKKPNI